MQQQNTPVATLLSFVDKVREFVGLNTKIELAIVFCFMLTGVYVNWSFNHHGHKHRGSKVE